MRKSFSAAIVMGAATLALGLVLGCPVARAAAGAQNPVEKLLDQVKAESQQNEALFARNRAAYAAATQAQQKQMMAQAQAALAKVKAASSGLSDQFSTNQLQITKLVNQLQGKAESLGLTNVFSIAQKTADTFDSDLQNALSNTQFSPAQGEPARLAFLIRLAGDPNEPTLNDLQRLWYEMQRELTAQGEVVRYQAPVVQSNNRSVSSPVIRVGPFMASSEGRYLEYLPELNTLAVLPRELPGGYRSTLARLQRTTSGYTRAVIDTSGGTLVQEFMQAPTWLERIHLGGKVGYVIIIIGIIGLILFFIQLVRLVIIRFAVTRQLKNLNDPRNNNPLGRVLLAFRGDPGKIEEEADSAELRITEAVLREEPKIERFQSYLRLAVAAGPLLGLIGTVVGMIITFQTITETGSADPRLMATGIGHAMIATVLGLAVAIVLLFANALLRSISANLMQLLDKQSAGMLAEKIETQRNA